MCGVNGIYAYHGAADLPKESELLATRDHMTVRGPDGAGCWWSDDRSLGLGHRRLSIIDLSSRAAQPMVSADGRYVIVYNGEIYNYPTLRTELLQDGAEFRTTSDTEILLHLYMRLGGEAVHKLRGMFAFAIWDNASKSLFLARDHYGIKPLYYADDGRTFRFASQVKALLAGGSVSREPDPAGQAGFFLWGSVPEPFTAYEAIRALPAGSTIMVGEGGVQQSSSYFSLCDVYGSAGHSSELPGSRSDLGRTVRSALLDSVKHHLVADVPVGAFLSSGIDSGALVGLMCDAGQRNVQTVTLAFKEFEGKPVDEAPLARELASYFGTHHTTRTVTRSEFDSDLPLVLQAMDQPTIDGLNSWFVAKAARELGLKVAISGLGGDELFGSYPAFRDVPNWVSWSRLPSSVPYLGVSLRKLGQVFRLDVLGVSPKALSILEYSHDYAGAYLVRRGLFMPWELEKLMGRERARAGLEKLDPLNRLAEELSSPTQSPFARVATLEATIYMRNQLLRDVDWASMAHSLEVRVPLVDQTLTRIAASLVEKWGGAASKELLADAPSRPLPQSVRKRNKTGFTVPIGRWSSSARQRGPFSYTRNWARRISGQVWPECQAYNA